MLLKTAFCFLIARLACTQSFVVATLKTAGSNPARMEATGGPGTKSPGRYICTHCPLMFLIRSAYGVPAARVTGPSWIDTALYDVAATLPPASTKDQFGRMLQSLLAERLAMRVHRVTKQVSGYDLVIAGRGPKLKRSTSSGDADINASLRAPHAKDAEGFPILPNGFDGPLYEHIPQNATMLMYRRADESMEKLADYLATTLKAPVRDRTGLQGKYETRLSYEVNLSEMMLNGEPMAPPGSAADPQITDSTIGASLEKRLGLKLTRAKVDVDSIVIDRIEKKPST
jgi:uncharacterized protein (TIGR03435 family)